MNPPTNDDLLAEEGLTAEMLIESGRELEELVLASMTPEKLLTRIPEANLLHLWEDNEHLRKQLIAHTSPEERMEGISPEERIAGMSPEERIAGMSPEERIAGMSSEEMAILMKQIERYLQQHPAQPTSNT